MRSTKCLSLYLPLIAMALLVSKMALGADPVGTWAADEDSLQ